MGLKQLWTSKPLNQIYWYVKKNLNPVREVVCDTFMLSSNEGMLRQSSLNSNV